MCYIKVKHRNVIKLSTSKRITTSFFLFLCFRLIKIDLINNSRCILNVIFSAYQRYKMVSLFCIVQMLYTFCLKCILLEGYFFNYNVYKQRLSFFFYCFMHISIDGLEFPLDIIAFNLKSLLQNVMYNHFGLRFLSYEWIMFLGSISFCNAIQFT